uniref:Peptidase S1 domain-containing protein n=1 Tax=Arion vulgaris TaxID=1028688 RepID=A0A0B7BC95_9EUPU
MKSALKYLSKQNKHKSQQQKSQHQKLQLQTEGNRHSDMNFVCSDEDIETDGQSTQLHNKIGSVFECVIDSNPISVQNGMCLIGKTGSARSIGDDTPSQNLIPSNEMTNRYSQSDLHTNLVPCIKHPGHERFIPIIKLNSYHFPENFQTESWVKLIRLKAVDVVRLVVSCTSKNRPEELSLTNVKDVRYGTGTAFLYKMDKTEQCDCTVATAGHSVSGLFRVMTASHVVFDDEEAKNTTVEFFYDSADTSTVIRGWGVRVCHIDVMRNRSIIECQTHDLNLCQRLTHALKERNHLIAKELEPHIVSVLTSVIISHPHGMCKQVTFGKLKEMKEYGVARTTKEGVMLIDCMLTYDTPTCPGTGGGPVNVIGGGTTCYAFAPHCASKGNDENISGLGWTRVSLTPIEPL